MVIFQEQVRFMYKPSSVMEWRVSPVQGKTLCKVTVGAGGKAVFPEKKTINISTCNQSLLCTLHHTFCFFYNEMHDKGNWKGNCLWENCAVAFLQLNSKMILTLRNNEIHLINDDIKTAVSLPV